MTEGARLSLEVRERLGGEENPKTKLAEKMFRLLTAMYLVGEQDDFLRERLETLDNAVKTVALRVLGHSISRKDREFSVEVREAYGGIGSKIGVLAESVYLTLSIICRRSKPRSELHTMYIGTKLVTKEIIKELYDYSLNKGADDLDYSFLRKI